MAETITPWYFRPSSRWVVFRSVPFSSLWSLLLAIFLLFSISGFYADLISRGTRPYAVVFMIAAYSGINACLWVIVFARLPSQFLIGLILLQFVNDRIIGAIARWMTAHFALKPVLPDAGIHFSAKGMFWASILAYVFFLRYIVHEGKQSIRIRNELNLAHGMQKTLVPVLNMRTPGFEIYGTSQPSEKVGGDLVDAVLLPDGDTVVYLADIAGHGLPASILMGRLKTAIRTALLDAGERDASETLPILLDRLNVILPQVKEPHMYATFTGFRLCADGRVFCALAASPPVVQWHANTSALSHMQEPQLPLGLLPYEGYAGHRLDTAPGDLLVVATDGILEVSNKAQDEFGLDRLDTVIAGAPGGNLPEIAGAILAAARGFGLQQDDQTILVVRRL